jgi:[CysO sulfur-carrier protein]-S-L-cysteine hydrolase
MTFHIRQVVLDAIVAHARAEAPAECCGMLIGRGASIDDAVRAKNMAAAPTRFLIDPKDHIDARRGARDRGLEVVGFYHSHPASPAWPSETDIAEAAYPDAVHMVVSLTGGVADARLFRIERSAAIQVPLDVD